MNWDESVLRNFVPYHRCCLCVFGESAHDQLAVRISPSYKNLAFLSIVDVDAVFPQSILYDGGDAFVAVSPPTD